ncbi:MAG: SNF2-related protein [Coriobacteriales bacterium]
MIPESAIAQECFNKTFARARVVAKNGGFVFNRRCNYEPDYTELRATMESSSWNDFPYDVRVTFDEQGGQILDYSCSCPAYFRYPGMCKHTAGLALLFNAEPESFKGYCASKQTATSPSITGLLQRMGARGPARAQHGASGTGSVDFTLSLEQTEADRFGASFKLCTPAASYVLKDIATFLEDIERGAFREYGKKLGFTHVRPAFTEHGWQLVKWMQRCANANSSWWQRDFWSGAHSYRTMYIGTCQLAELLELYLGRSIAFIPLQHGSSKKPQALNLQVVEQDPQLQLQVRALEDGGFELERGGRLGFAAFDELLFAWDERCIYRCSPALSRCAAFLCEAYGSSEEHLFLSAEDAPLFCKTLLPLLQETLQLQAPAELERLRPVEAKLEFYLDASGGRAECRAKALYGQEAYELMHPGNEPGKPARDEQLEDAARETVRRYLPQLSEDGAVAQTGSDEDMARLLFHGIDELRRWGEVYATDALTRRKASRNTGVQAGVSLKSNLVRLSVSASELSPAEVAALLQSYQAKKTYHKLKDGSFLNLQEPQQAAELEHLGSIAAELGLSARDIARGELELPAYHAFVLDALTTEEEKEESFLRFVEGFADRRGLSYELPAPLQGVLRPYQVEGFEWMSMLADNGLGGILADEMGLGKSLQVISLLLSRRAELQQQPALVVCPASLVYNWMAEFAKFAPQMRVAALAGPKAQRSELLEQGGFEVLVASYDTLRIDIPLLAERAFSYQVIDEAQYIKNHATKAARAVKAVQAAHRLALTGTPIENRLSELWSIFDYLMPGMLGPYARFRERYETPIVNGEEEASARLGAKVGPFILRRLKAQVLRELPDKLESVVHAKLEGEQLKLYSAHESRLRRSLADESEQELREGRIAVLAELTKLRQLCCDPRLLYSNARGSGAKLGAIAELVQSAQDSGQKVLIFSQFTSFLALIGAELSAHGWSYYTITGATPKEERVQLVERFNADEVPVFLISLKAGGTGLNLTGASVVIHADPWWNAAAQNQATDRAHRIGQSRDVSVFKVIADGTIEERILELQEAKSNLADAVLQADGASLASLSREELIGLLGGD